MWEPNSTRAVWNQQVSGQNNYKRSAPQLQDADRNVHMLIVACDYASTDHRLSASYDGQNMLNLSRHCGITKAAVLQNDRCTKHAVLSAIKQTGSLCQANDYFIIYISSHAAYMQEVADHDARGPEEAFLFVDENGQMTSETLLLDTEFSKAVLSSCNPTARIVIITDCCHAGAIIDMDQDCWTGREAVAIAGCRDRQITEESGRGSLFTHSLLLAVDKLTKVGWVDYSVGLLFNAALNEDEAVFQGKQDMVLQHAPGFAADQMAWPLAPMKTYEAPLNQYAEIVAQMADRKHAPAAIEQQQLARIGVPAPLLQHVQLDSFGAPTIVEEYIRYVSGQNGRGKPCRGCAATQGACSVQ